MTGPNRDVVRCRQSTITEAWTIIQGAAAAVDQSDSLLIMRRARSRFPDLEVMPAIVAVPTPGDSVAPFWSSQVRWDGGARIARFGHRYLSVHVLPSKRAPYTRFDDVVLPSLTGWLTTYVEAFSPPPPDHPVASVAFGYVNTFEFAPADFDVSRYFKLTLGFDVGAQRVGVHSLGFAVHYVDEERDIAMTLDLQVQAPNSDDAPLRVLTRVSAERAPMGCTFSSTAELLAEVGRAKDAAKQAFFAFVTDETQRIMEAEYGDDAHATSDAR